MRSEWNNQALSADDERHANVHRVAHEAVQAFDDEDLVARSAQAFRRRSERSPERGVEIDRNPDDDNGYGDPFFGAGHRCRILLSRHGT